MTLQTRKLGTSSIEVTAMSLGSFKTFERISRDAGLAVMRAAQEEGINFLDDSAYPDETGTAPIPVGYSEVIFGELFRAAGWNRDEVVLANKLWWREWPTVDASSELEASLGRMKIDHVDVIYALAPPEGLSVEDAVAEATGLITAGKAREWGLLNWSPDQIREAHRIAVAESLPTPLAAQLPYSIVQTSPVEDYDMVQALAETNVAVVSSYSLAAGVLTGKYGLENAQGRAIDRLAEDRLARAVAATHRLKPIAEELGVDLVTLALAYVLANPSVVSVLSGATSAEQLHQNAAAVRRATELGADTIEKLRGIAASV